VRFRQIGSAGNRYQDTGKLNTASRLMISRAALVAGTIAATIVIAPNAEAYPYWSWSDDAPVYDAPSAHGPKRPLRKRHHHNTRNERQIEKQVEQQASKPRGPVVIAVSIEQQRLRVYDADGLFAETPVSTGMRGHSTPMGVFSVIQKHKYHRSNIYSGAPMPYMQRITWSGVAMHAGVLPGYPASHGCIRMPMAFAMKMWGWTRMGARVIVAPGDATPASFSHPLLATRKIVADPVPVAADAPKPTSAAKSDKSASAAEPAGPAETTGLRPGLAADSMDQAADQSGAAQVRTADASAATLTLTDAGPAKTTPPDAPAQTTSADPAAPTPAPSADAAPADTAAKDHKAEAGAAEPAKAPVPIEAGTTDSSASKDQSRAASEAPPTPALPAIKPKAQLAAFVSGKDGKLYIRQDQAPVFNVPVKVTPSDRPLGTHVFTAELDKDNNVRWTVVSLPERRAESVSPQRKSRRHSNELAEDPKARPQPGSAAEALDRLTIPPEALTRIAEALSTGGSLIVSDQAIAAGETGEGTDFIIRLR